MKKIHKKTKSMSSDISEKLSPISGQQHSIDELCQLVDISKRTIRFYIQQGLVAKPYGEKRGSFYTNEHLERLLEIKKWQNAGLSLERIKEILTFDLDNLPLPPVKQPKAGDVSVWSRVFIDEGVEIHIDPAKTGMSPEKLRDFIQQVTQFYQRETQAEK